MNVLIIAALFFLIGSLTIGGGLVSIALIDQYLVQAGYISRHLFEVMISIAESTPGPIAINLATLIGFQEASWLGAVFMTLSFVLPSIIAVRLIAIPMLNNGHRPMIQMMMKYLSWSVGAIIFYAVYTLIRTSTIFSNDISMTMFVQIGIVILMVVLSYQFPKHPLWLIALGGLIGFIFF
jgi:chromate transporter